MNDPPARLSLLIEQELFSHFGLSSAEAAEQSEVLEYRLVALIERKLAETEALGTAFDLALVGAENARMICGGAYAFPGDSEQHRKLKANRSKAKDLLAAIVSLSPSEFEGFGARVLELLGAQEVHVTRQSNDQGIDFYGVLRIGELVKAPESFFHISHRLELRFAGQAKHYPNSAVGTAVIRELVGSVSLARFKAFSSEVDMFEELGLRPFNPLVLLLFTTGNLTKGARELAERAGILCYSGDQLSAFLADNGVGVISDGGDVQFDEGAFRAWLK